jgi:hypothetical protein
MTPDRRKNRAEAFQDCLDRLDGTGQGLEAVLEAYPEQAETLRPELETARWLVERRPELGPRPGFVGASRARLLGRLAEDPRRTSRPVLGGSLRSLRYPSTWRRYAPRLALAYLFVLTLLFSLGRVSKASLNWLPGDLAYPLKLGFEETALFFSPTAAGDARLHTEFAHRRLLEAQALVFENRFEHIPGTVTKFSRQVDQAVGCVDRVARRDRGQAQALALNLERILSDQELMVGLLSGFTPPPERLDFQRMLIVAEDGVSAVQQVIDSGSRGASGMALAWAPAYSIVR